MVYLEVLSQHLPTETMEYHYTLTWQQILGTYSNTGPPGHDSAVQITHVQ